MERREEGELDDESGIMAVITPSYFSILSI